MPLNCQISKPNGHTVKVCWDEHTLNSFLSIGMSEGDPELWKKLLPDAENDPDFFIRTTEDGVQFEIPMNFMTVPVYYLETDAPLWKRGEHIVQKDHTYMISTEFKVGPMGANDAEAKPFVFKKGWTLSMWRS